MPGRVRSIDYGYHTGRRFIPSTGYSASSSAYLGRSSCTDRVSEPYHDNPLSIDHRRLIRVGTVSGGAGPSTLNFDEYPLGLQTIPSHLSFVDVPSDAAAATELLAKTNPSRAEGSIINFLLELREIPNMLFKSGINHYRDRPSRGSNSTVEYNFGWDLLIKDLQSMFKFTEHVNNRVKELNGLYSGAGLKRRRILWSGSTETISGLTSFHSLSGYVTGLIRIQTRGRKWASTRWTPDNPTNIPSADELLQTARRVVQGISGPQIIMWNAIPWSWFVDYFANVGSYLVATNNSVGASPSRSCVMTEYITRKSLIIKDHSPYFSVTSGMSEHITRSRALQTAGLSASLPFLTTKQLMTLSSIAINR